MVTKALILRTDEFFNIEDVIIDVFPLAVSNKVGKRLSVFRLSALKGVHFLFHSGKVEFEMNFPYFAVNDKDEVIEDSDGLAISNFTFRISDDVAFKLLNLLREEGFEGEVTVNWQALIDKFASTLNMPYTFTETH